MPPAIVPLALVAIGIPAALRAALGRPRMLGSAWLAASAAAAVAQVVGELAGVRTGVLGDAQLLLAAIGSALASAAVAILERRAR
jgi:hypothetical protein